MNLKERARQLKIDIPAISFALKHKRTQWYAKIMAGITVAYALSPIDLIPDFIPVLGYLDDIILFPLFIIVTIKLIPSDLFQECRIQSESIWKEGMPKRWFYALPIIAVWTIVFCVIIKLICSG